MLRRVASALASGPSWAAALRPVLGPTLPARFPGSRLRRALRERGRLALPRALGRRQLLLESVPLSAEPIPLGCQARALVLQAVPLVLHASDLRVLLRNVAAQPSVGLLELFDAFPGLEAEQWHPRHNSGRHGFCPVLIEKPCVFGGSDPLSNYSRRRSHRNRGGLRLPERQHLVQHRAPHHRFALLRLEPLRTETAAEDPFVPEERALDSGLLLFRFASIWSVSATLSRKGVMVSGWV